MLSYPRVISLTCFHTIQLSPALVRWNQNTLGRLTVLSNRSYVRQWYRTRTVPYTDTVATTLLWQ